MKILVKGLNKAVRELKPLYLTSFVVALLIIIPISNFIFEGSKESVRKQIGMAVPVKGAKILFDSILKTFEGIDYPSIDGKF